MTRDPTRPRLAQAPSTTGVAAPAGARPTADAERHQDAHPHSLHRPTLTSCFALIGLVWALLVVTPHVTRTWNALPVAGGWMDTAALSLLGAFALALVVIARRVLHATLTSIPFSVAMLLTLMLATIAGTLVVQKAAPEEYLQRYGETGSQVVAGLALADLFHSLWFNGLLVVLAVSLVLVTLRNRTWRLAWWGHLMSHAGVVVVLVGGVIGNMGGLKGFIDLHEGQRADTVVRTDAEPGESRLTPLGFSILLEEFDVDRYDDAWRLFLYEAQGDEFKIARAWTLDEGSDWVRAGPAGDEIRIVRAWPDFELERELVESDDPRAVPALRIERDDGHGHPPAHLLAGIDGRDSVQLHDGTRIRLVREAPAEPTDTPAPTGPSHEIVVGPPDDGHDHGPSRRLRVAPGGVYDLPDGQRLAVHEHYHAFTFDMQTRTARNTSDEPTNPALQVELIPAGAESGERRWLFANVPDYAAQHGKEGAPLQLVYRYEHAPEVPALELLVVAGSGETWRLERGVPASRLPLAEALRGLPVGEATLFARAVERQEPGSRSDTWTNPAIELQHRLGPEGEARTLTMRAEHEGALRLSDDRAVLVLGRRGDDVKAFTSRVAVIEDGQKVHEALVRVNEPLEWRGFMFYQSNYRPEDPTYSGFQVVADPGLSVVFTGFALMCAGVIFIYHLRPRILKWRAA